MGVEHSKRTVTWRLVSSPQVFIFFLITLPSESPDSVRKGGALKSYFQKNRERLAGRLYVRTLRESNQEACRPHEESYSRRVSK